MIAYLLAHNMLVEDSDHSWDKYFKTRVDKNHDFIKKNQKIGFI